MLCIPILRASPIARYTYRPVLLAASTSPKLHPNHDIHRPRCIPTMLRDEAATATISTTPNEAEESRTLQSLVGDVPAFFDRIFQVSCAVYSTTTVDRASSPSSSRAADGVWNRERAVDNPLQELVHQGWRVLCDLLDQSCQSTLLANGQNEKSIHQRNSRPKKIFLYSFATAALYLWKNVPPNTPFCIKHRNQHTMTTSTTTIISICGPPFSTAVWSSSTTAIVSRRGSPPCAKICKNHCRTPTPTPTLHTGRLAGRCGRTRTTAMCSWCKCTAAASRPKERKNHPTASIVSSTACLGLQVLQVLYYFFARVAAIATLTDLHIIENGR